MVSIFPYIRDLQLIRPRIVASMRMRMRSHKEGSSECNNSAAFEQVVNIYQFLTFFTFHLLSSSLYCFVSASSVVCCTIQHLQNFLIMSSYCSCCCCFLSSLMPYHPINFIRGSLYSYNNNNDDDSYYSHGVSARGTTKRCFLLRCRCSTREKNRMETCYGQFEFLASRPFFLLTQSDSSDLESELA